MTSSISIDSRRISGVYALGQWFKVKINSFRLDHYSLIDFPCDHLRFGDEDVSYKHGKMREPIQSTYELGSRYPESDYQGRGYVSGSTGAQWIDRNSGETITVSLAEIKGWRMVDEATATEACPYLSRDEALKDREAYMAMKRNRKG